MCHIPGRGPIIKMHNEVTKLNNKKTATLKTRGKIWAESSPEIIKGNRHVNKCSTSLKIRKMQIKTTTTLCSYENVTS